MQNLMKHTPLAKPSLDEGNNAELHQNALAVVEALMTRKTLTDNEKALLNEAFEWCHRYECEHGWQL